MSRIIVCFWFVLTSLFPAGYALASRDAVDVENHDILVLTGTIFNSQGKGVKEAALEFFINNEKVDMAEALETSKSGRFEAEILLPGGILPDATVEMTVKKPSYEGGGEDLL